MHNPSNARAGEANAHAAPRRVVLVHPGALGDLVQALPALAAVRTGWPQAHLTLATDAALEPLVSALGLVDATIGFDAGVAYRGGVPARALLVARLVAALRTSRPEVVGVFKGAAVYAALAAASGARVRVGLTRGIGARALTIPIAVLGTRHREDRYADVVRGLGLEPLRRAAVHWPAVPVPLPADSGAPRRWLAVAPGGARNAKEVMESRRWPAERFARVAARMLAEDAGLGAVLLGGPGDRAEVAQVIAALPAERTANLAGATDVLTARAVIAAAAAYLGNDSGLMHVAATTETPTVIVFGPTDPRVAAPRTPGMHALWSPIGTTACVDDATGSHRPCATECCITRVTEAEVAAALRRVLTGGPAADTTSPTYSGQDGRVELSTGRPRVGQHVAD